MTDLSKQVFDQATALNGAYRRGLEARPLTDLATVYLLWINSSVLGIYRTYAQAESDAQGIMASSEYRAVRWEERGHGRWAAGDATTVRIEKRSVA